MRLIDADALKEAMAEHTNNIGYLVCAPEEIIDLAPTVARPHGEWKRPLYRYGTNANYECSNCKDVFEYGYNFCPNCGADMREEGDPE